jgi:methyl-accepting chemotaxis protein
MKNPFIVRRQYLISKPFQLKYTFMIIVFMFLIAWLAGYTVYYTVFSLLGEKLANVYPQGRLTFIFRTVNLTLFFRILLLLPFVVIISIILSHRIAGPVFRMKQFLSEVARGDLSSMLTLRKRDEFKGLADAINTMTQNLRDVTGENQEIADKLLATLDEMNVTIKQSSLDKDRLSALAKKAGDEIRQLKENLDKHKI